MDDIIVKVLNAIESFFWLLIKMIYTLVDEIYKVIVALGKLNVVTDIFNGNSKFVNLYSFSIRISIYLLLLFSLWAIIKMLLEPEQAPPLGTIIKEIVKVIILISMTTFIFTKSSTFIVKLTDDLLSETDTSTSIAVPMLRSMIYVDESLKNFDTTGAYMYSDSESCNYEDLTRDLLESKGSKPNKIEFDDWGNINSKSSVEKFNNWISNESTFKTSNGFLGGNFFDYKAYNWRYRDDGIKTGFRCGEHHFFDGTGDRIYNTNSIIILVVGCFFFYALILGGMGLAMRVIELCVLLVIMPCVLATSVCRPQQRSVLWQSLASFLLQSVGMFLVIIMAIYLLNWSLTGGGISFFKTQGLNSYAEQMIVKIFFIIGAGTMIIKGPTTLSKFIGEHAGVASGQEALRAISGFALTGAIIGRAGLSSARSIGGMALKAPAGIRNVGVGSVLGASHIREQANKIGSKYSSSDIKRAEYKQRADDIANNRERFRERMDNRTIDGQYRGIKSGWNNRKEGSVISGIGGIAMGTSNRLSVMGDKLMGRKNTPKISKNPYAQSGTYIYNRSDHKESGDKK